MMATSSRDDGVAPSSLARRLARISTGFKIFAILSVALLPLGLIALLASAQSSRTTDLERQAIVRVALTETSRTLGAEIAADITTLRRAVDSIQANPLDAEACPLAFSVLRVQSARPPRFAIFTSLGELRCATRGFSPPRPLVKTSDPPTTATIVPEHDELRLLVRSSSGAAVAVVQYPRARLIQKVRPAGYVPPYALALADQNGSGTTLELSDTLERTVLMRTDTVVHSIGIADLALVMSVGRVPLTAAEILSLLTPLLMWLAAATVGWLVVDRMLIAPLKQLEGEVAAYQPGTTMNFRRLTGPSQELRQLGESFRTLGQTVSAHEAELEAGLARQTKLTREVHHRVKNNLQVVASLINLHARAAKSAEATAAYASIQRRVDALSVVHRNHYAELEENIGLALRSLIAEIAANFRANAPETGRKPTIMLDIMPLHITQDVAVAIAFLITELLELALLVDGGAHIAISAVRAELPGRVLLRLQSAALVSDEGFDHAYAQGFGRVIEGLSRQLRSPMMRDGVAGSFAIGVPVLDRPVLDRPVPDRPDPDRPAPDAIAPSDEN